MHDTIPPIIEPNPIDPPTDDNVSVEGGDDIVPVECIEPRIFISSTGVIRGSVGPEDTIGSTGAIRPVDAVESVGILGPVDAVESVEVGPATTAPPN
jgi:hypothetical protein